MFENLDQIKAAGEAYKSKVEERLALERELVASTLKYGALTNEVRVERKRW